MMLETILSLPIYLILLAGLFWTGDIVTSRSKLLAADHAGTWTNASRHNNLSSGTIAGTFYGGQMGSGNYDVANITGFNLNSSTGTNSEWHGEYRTRATLSMRQPIFVSTVARLTNLLWQRGETEGLGAVSNRTITMDSRSDHNYSSYSYTQSVNARNTSDLWRRSLRDGEDLSEQLKPNWMLINNEVFPGDRSNSNQITTGGRVRHYLRAGNGTSYATFY